MGLDEFRNYNKENNPSYLAALESNTFTPVLPSPDQIYYKDYHFLDAPLINMKHVSLALEGQ